MSQDETRRAKVMRLADALMQDILTASDDDILSEVNVVHIQRARAIFLEVKARTSKQLLDTAKIRFEGWRSLQIRAGGQLNKTETREQFEKILRDDPVLNEKMTVAARNGKAPTGNDMFGLAEDLADLRRLEDEDTLE